MLKTEIEVCIEDPDTAELAAQYGANRVELCSALDLGGLTPSAGLIEACVAVQGPEVFAMIRPRGGDFTYSSREVDSMARDIEAAQKAGAGGVVFGCLHDDHRLDMKTNKHLIDIAHSMNMGTTFHRAFDFTPDPESTLEKLIELGFDRLLTSGTRKTAIEGIETIRKLVKIANGRIDIMAGSGVNDRNAAELLTTGIQAIHFTARTALTTKDPLDMGIRYVPDPEKIKKIIHAIA